jgi:AraC-like DNA-binding protein
MRKAAQLLLNSDLTISEIALEVGYLSLSHFSSVFRQRFGVSPREFRRNPRAVGATLEE